jgi:DNA-binding winged helix-turn-helix (wHTH) protein/TolB-like protein/Tfp pilus assembly protein PilF
MPLKAKPSFEFGVFRFDMAERILWREDHIVPITPKALDTLAALLEIPGRLVEKEDLIKAVWRDTFVEEGNLAVQISLLRKTFGDDTYIETVPRRGYRFVAAIREVAPEPAATHAPAPPVAPDPAPGLPAPATPAPAAKLTRRWLWGTAAGAAGGAILWRAFSNREAQGRTPVAVIAVLPFQILQAKPDDAPLALGLTDAVITRLGSANRFIVRPTSAVRQFDQPVRDPVSAGKTLGVEAVLEATIQAMSGQIRINAQLIRIRDGKHLWADTFDLERADLFTLEDELSNRLVRSLFGEGISSARHRPKPEAFRLYTLGRHYRNRWSAASAQKAVEYAGQAIAIDHDYAAAHALLADAWSVLGYFFGVPPRDAYPKAEAAARMAISLDDSSSEAHHVAGAVQLFYYWDFAKAERHLRTALELNPSNPESVHLFGLLRAIQRRNAEGVSALRKAVEIDPASAWRHVGMSFQYACSKQIQAAIAEAKKAHELDPMLGAPMFDLYNLHMVRGDHRRAVDWYLKQNTRPGSDPALAAMRETFDKKGIRGFLEARIAHSLKHTPRIRTPLVIAQQYAFLGRRDEAMLWVEKSMEERQSTILFINQHPMYASLRGHPKFEQIVRTIGL